MIRFRLAELIADAQFRTGKRITLLEISQATGINRMTLSRMANVRGYSTSTDTLDKLCQYFQCDVSDLARYVSEEAVAAQAKPSAKSPARASTPASAKKASRRVTKRA